MKRNNNKTQWRHFLTLPSNSAQTLMRAPPTFMRTTMSIQEQQINPRASFKQEMQTRHIVMLALGGVIGTGLFLTSGYTVNQAGPLGAVIAYIIGALMVYMVMMCLGELAVQMPETGSFSTYATRFLGPGTGYTVAWLYWLTWTVAIGSEFTAAGILMVRWFPDRAT